MARVRSQWSGPPRHGTKSNEIFRKLLRGLRSDIAIRDYGQHTVKATLRTLEDNCGYDIRTFKSNERHLSAAPRGPKHPKHPKVMMIVGRHKWNGGYVSFINPDNYQADF